MVTREEASGAGGQRAPVQTVPREGCQGLLVGETAAVGELAPGLELMVGLMQRAVILRTSSCSYFRLMVMFNNLKVFVFIELIV